ncbi:hypothetical protein DFJ63DRAFT_108604 [Scheffersomyces coipomensis]|uniref:uncharacterized protein n=1 Tax=Scheffersomyces coipomensis TaxID=1788519 RepID=UPI00315D7BBA
MYFKSILSFSFFAWLTIAKNVVDLDEFKLAVQREIQNEKRDAKFVVDLEALKQAVKVEAEGLNKRDAKNVVDLNAFKIALSEEVKAGKVSKRAAKYLIDLSKFQEAVKQEVDSFEKRDEQNPFTFIIDVDDSNSNILQSVLPQIQSISIISGYIRDNEEISVKTELTNETMVIIAPTNDAISNNLGGLKPWEFPNPITDKMSDETVEKVLYKNIESFLQNHIVSNFEQNLIINKEDKLIETNLMNGDLLKIKQHEETEQFEVQVIRKKHKKSTGWIPVQMVKQVDNGFIFIIDETLVKP